MEENFDANNTSSISIFRRLHSSSSCFAFRISTVVSRRRFLNSSLVHPKFFNNPNVQGQKIFTELFYFVILNRWSNFNKMLKQYKNEKHQIRHKPLVLYFAWNLLSIVVVEVEALSYITRNAKQNRLTLVIKTMTNIMKKMKKVLVKMKL